VTPSRDEQGTALVEFVWLGILLLVPLVYILIAVFDVQRGSFGVSAASQAAGRAYSLADSDAEGLRQAYAAAAVALDDQGLGDQHFDLAISCHPAPPPCHARGQTIVIRVGVRVMLPLSPPALGGDAPTFALSAEHQVPIGRYRDLTP
jgi:hypothetical protein